MLKIINFSKKYRGAKKYSAKDITFSIERGEILGIVGSNGAGKSTTIKCLSGILPYEEGEIIIDGHDLKKEAVVAKQLIGYVPDDHSVYEKLTGREYVNYMGSLFGVKKADKKARLDYYSELFDLSYALDNQISSYSHGMKQKICIIGSLIHEPQLWILDEPMVGLDPQTMNEVKNCILNYADKGNSVLFSSHNLYVVQEICDLVAIIKKGELVEFFDLRQVFRENPNFDLNQYFLEINEV